MSTETRQVVATDRPRRPRKSETRTWTWVNALATAPTGDKALTDMMRWLWSTLASLEAQSPKAAEAARWEIARQLAPVIVALPRSRYTLRAGLTDAERQALIGQPGQRGGDGQ